MAHKWKNPRQIGRYNPEKPFITGWRILDNMIPPNEFTLFTIYAGLGKGKSAYAIINGVFVLVNYYDMDEADAWEAIKQWIVFHPKQFFAKLEEIENSGINRAPFLIWDDAGLWLYALDWNDPFIKALGKYLNVVRSRLGSLIMTTPSPKMIFTKLRDFPDAINVKINKTTGAKGAEWVREGKAYQQTYLPDQKKMRVHHRYTDDFVCRLPDDFFDWYKPLRDEYEKLAYKMIVESWEKSQKKHEDLIPELIHFPALQLPTLQKPEPKI